MLTELCSLERASQDAQRMRSEAERRLKSHLRQPLPGPATANA
jgi:hypothetical protein